MILSYVLKIKPISQNFKNDMGNDNDSDKEIRYSNERQRKIIIKIKLSEDDILDNLII